MQRLLAKLKETPFEVHKVLDFKNVGGDDASYVYLVKWVGFPESQSTWEPATVLTPEQSMEFWGNPIVESVV